MVNMLKLLRSQHLEDMLTHVKMSCVEIRSCQQCVLGKKNNDSSVSDLSEERLQGTMDRNLQLTPLQFTGITTLLH